MKRLILLTIVLAAGCTSAPEASTPAFEADGIHVRHLRLRVVPEQTRDFEELMKACVAAAREIPEPERDVWICYREPPGHYWLIQFSRDIETFRFPEGLDGFVMHLAARSPVPVRQDLRRRIGSLNHEIRWNIITQQTKAWSTTDSLDASTYPRARMMMRTVKPGLERVFSAALAARTAFFVEHRYELPIEGFVTRRGDPMTQLQIVYARDWSSFHARESFGEFVKRLPKAARDDYAGRKAALMRTMNDAAWYHGNYAPELSFDP